MGISRRKQRETESLREQVLDTAETIIAQEGTKQVTMRRIAAGIDYAPTVLYRLFANKADLMDHLIARGYAGVRERYRAVMRRRHRGPEARLAGILAAYVEYALAHPNHYRMWFETGSASFDGQHLHMQHGRLAFVVFRTWLDCIEACQAIGMYPGWNAMEAFQVLWTRVHGLIALRLQHPGLPWLPLASQLDEVLDLRAR